jgi:hypothetical protein
VFRLILLLSLAIVPDLELDYDNSPQIKKGGGRSWELENRYRYSIKVEKFTTKSPKRLKMDRNS